ncbi:SDR family NAD(P)-dependent oxidoreductase [Salinisphaera sp. RV14]|uniref:SDR family NAD(P)-dependent oxidoreductase n=1 Tax=Salinisphaera sp. RV14 TaxID=3454140 RepID=UPI003F83F255
MTTSTAKAYVITGPTSGIGRLTALELAKHGTVILVGRDRNKLADVQAIIGRRGQQAEAFTCDLSDIASVRRAAAEIIALDLPIAGLLNNAGMVQGKPTKNALGWDMTFATNYLGPFAFTEALAPHLPEGAHVVFVASGVEDPERTPAVKAGYRGGRFLSVASSIQGEWEPGGSKLPGGDAYATSKQCVLAATLALARENKRLLFNAIEPGFTPNTGLVREAPAAVRFVIQRLLPLLAPFLKYWSTPKRAARLATTVLTDTSTTTGVYYGDDGQPMAASSRARNPEFQDELVAQTRILLATVPA